MTDLPLRTWKGRRVRSAAEGPEAAAAKVPAAPLGPGSLFFVPSPLEGWGLETLLDRLPADGVVVCFEKDEDLRADRQRAFGEWLGGRLSDGRLFELKSDTENEVRALFNVLPLARLRRCEFLPLNGAWLAHAARYRELFSRVDRGLTQWWSNRATHLAMGPLWIKNLLDNAPRAAAGSPWPDWGTSTVLVCGAGVTLESALPWAVQHRSSLRIIAADTALAALKAWSLVPDVVVCLEAQHANLRDFAGWSGADVTLLADVTSYPPATRVFSRPPAWLASEFADLALWRRWPWPQIPRLPALGSVGVAAAWVAWHLSHGPVVLAGLDFSYPVGRTHARGTPAVEARLARASRLAPPDGGAWAGAGTREPRPGWLTTPVMEGYAGTLIGHAEPHRQRTWLWEAGGLELGLPLWPRDALPPRGQEGTTPVQEPAGNDWLSSETERWTAALGAFERLNAHPDDATRADLEARLRDLDYLTFCFPDPEYRAATDWLARAQNQIRWALRRVSRPRRS